MATAIYCALVLMETTEKLRFDSRSLIQVQKEAIISQTNATMLDKTGIFEYTGIFLDALLEEERTELEQGFYVKDKQELYGILENYSS